MPEGPETHRMADRIHKSLVGKSILKFKFQHDSISKLNNLKTVSIIDVLSVGKAVVLRLENGYSIISHNQLYGKWTFNRPKTIINTNRQLRIEFVTKSKAVRLWSATDIKLFLTKNEHQHPYLKKIGPDVLDDSTSIDYIIKTLESKNACNRSLSSVLLDQSVISGLGNYLRSEILFFASLMHTQKVSELSRAKIDKLAKSIKEVSVRAYVQKGKTIDLNYFEKEFGNKENFRRVRHMVFSREGLPCFICGNLILKIIVSSRRIFLCPSCQNLKE